MMSALKRDGVRLYDLARRGIEVEREARPVTVRRLDILEYDPGKGVLTLDCACSKGTYIRVICDDLGRLLGCGAVMSGLRRTEAAGFSLADCLTLDEARELAAKGACPAGSGRWRPLLRICRPSGCRPAKRPVSATGGRWRSTA